MPSKTRWRLNPKKWFGQKSHAAQQRDSTSIQPPPTATTTTRTMTTGITTSTTNTKIIPLSLSYTMDKPTISTTHYQLPAFAVRRERNVSILNRSNTFQPTHTEPSIRKKSRIEENLSIDITRLSIPTIPRRIPDDFEPENTSKFLETSLSNLSHRCLVDYPRQTSAHLEHNSFPSRSSSPGSSSSLNDNSSSSGIFTDERQRTESKGTLSNLEVLSIESIADSQTSLNQLQATRPIIHHYRRPMSVFEVVEDKPQQRQTSFTQSHRSHSAEGLLNDNQTISSSKTRQSSAVNIKKTERRLSTSRSPSAALEKTGLVRITPDSYRLTTNQIDHFSFQTIRRNSNHSFVPPLDHDDALRCADVEEHYAELPRTSSTEYLNNNHDLRSMVDECVRPLMTSVGRNRATKYNRFRRPQVQQTQLTIEKITNRLLASVDYSIYSRYQRCN